VSEGHPPAEPLPVDWEEQDSLLCYLEYLALCREEQRRGLPPPAMFR
jgi:hypothetical protein